MHATGNLNRVGVGWVLAAVAGLALLALVWWGEFPPCGANKALHFLPMVGSWAHFFFAGGKRLLIDASQPAPPRAWSRPWLPPRAEGRGSPVSGARANAAPPSRPPACSHTRRAAAPAPRAGVGWVPGHAERKG